MQFTHRTPIIAAGAVLAALLTALLTVIIAGGNDAAGEAAGQYHSLAERSDAASGGAGAAYASEALDIGSLSIPNEGEALTKWEWKLHREPKSAWDEDDLSRFWIAPEEISIDYLVEQNDALIQEMFSSVP